jgi:hypothetical protein
MLVWEGHTVNCVRTRDWIETETWTRTEEEEKEREGGGPGRRWGACTCPCGESGGTPVDQQRCVDDEMQKDVEKGSRVIWARLEKEPRKRPKSRIFGNRDGQEVLWMNEA